MKYTTAFVVAGLINLGLFLLMSFMVEEQHGKLKKVDSIRLTDFTHLTPREKLKPLQPKQRELPKKPLTPKNPPPMATLQKQTIAPKSPSSLPKITTSVDLPLLANKMEPYLGSFGDALGSSLGTGTDMGGGDLIPIARIPPQYPYSAARRGIEGAVTIVFTVDKDGLVHDPKIIEAHPPGIFDQAALQSIKRWKFKRQGKDISEQRVTQTIDFTLAQ
ncbi:energy transducer TonB [Candidatus Nitrosacidococcus tergens]|uniref:Protein TonB n=1 Tax=Candidatus Nitrosacidococcus tergens TaxID=553981 RepID=A0A7G1QBM6_9GAMM|nr:energy transducer TonB [Candidatus Nitrosacidococcus tergens]CAB1277393.1 TonB family C-terminal domain protein [Candidatus Nitrosacidococcus tergens]